MKTFIRPGVAAAFLGIFTVGIIAGAARGQAVEIDLGDVAAGGDGTGSADPTFVGIHPDTGMLETFHLNAPIGIADGTALQPVEDSVSELIDSVFIIETIDMPINTGGATFSFPPEDLLAPPQTWDHILRDRIGGEDAPLILGGQAFEHGVGIHAAAGITYDLEALREIHGPEAVGEVSAFAGMGDSPSCLANPGSITAYLIVSDGEQVLDSASHRSSAGGRWLRLPIPPEARFLTLATGAGTGRFYCNAGTFGGAVIRPLSPLVVTRDLPDLFVAGETVAVSFNVEVNAVGIGDLEVRERIPYTWHAANPSPPGTLETDAGGRETVVWKLGPAAASQTLTYDLTVPRPFASVRFIGSSVTAGGRDLPIFGDEEVTGGANPNVGEALVITLRQPTTACAGAAIGEPAQARDYLTDGDEAREEVLVPAAGESVSPDFGGASPSPGSTGPGSLSWTRLAAPSGWFQLAPCDDCLSYLAFYAVNPTGRTLRVRAGVASDDGTQVLVDGKEVWNHSIARPSGGASIQDHSPLFDLTPGKHLVLQKVFEGCGGFDSAFRFEDEDQNPLVILEYTLSPTEDPPYQGAEFFVLRQLPRSLEPGGSGEVRLKLRIRTAPIAGGGVIEENVPPGLAVTEVLEGGVLDGRRITWTFAKPLSSRDLRYRVQVAPDALDGAFQGTAELGGRLLAIAGDRQFDRGTMNAGGFIKHWLILGPLETQGLWFGDTFDPPAGPDAASASPEGGDLRLDFLTDGTVREKTIRPFDGMRLLSRFGGDGITGAKALGLEAVPKDCAPAAPTWGRFVTRTGTLNHDDYFGGAVDSHATYAACYLLNTTPAPIATNLALHSDDACIAFLNGVEVLAYEPGPCSAAACGRGYGPEGTVAELRRVTLPPGESFLLVRVHDGIGASGLRLRFQDGAGNPLLPPAIGVSLRSSANPPAVRVTRALSRGSFRHAGEPVLVTLRVEAAGTHDLSVREILPADWSAGEVSDAGVQAGGELRWTLAALSGRKDLTYRLLPPLCAVSAGFCGSEYSVDGTATHAVAGDDSLRREAGNDDLGPWVVADLGAAGGGVERAGDHLLVITGRGAGIRTTRDECLFIHLPAAGDFEISARIDCFHDPGGLGLGGLMVRDTLDPHSAQVFFAFSSTPPAAGGAGTLRGLLRRETNPIRTVANLPLSDREVPALPLYLKVSRTGTRLSFQRSADSRNYTEVATREIGTGTTQVNLRTDTLIGIAVTGGGGGSSLFAFNDVSWPALFPEAPLGPPRSLTAAPGDRRVELAWQEPQGGGVDGYRVYRDGREIAECPSTETSFSDRGLQNGERNCYRVRALRRDRESDPSNEACASAAAGVLFRRGDADAGGTIDLTDAIYVLSHQFLGGPAPACFDAADADDSGAYDLTDAIFSLSWQFLGGPIPPAPGPDACGADPTGDDFASCIYGACQ